MLDASGLPPDNVLSMIARLEQARSTEQLKELLASLADWPRPHCGRRRRGHRIRDG